ncbi:hypothetical protein RJ641_019462 [Dillenia turbinata]|uniref:Pentatricopeptide repeat-containing protein n=1 Tax=Dillenia turbinata TaxID=194707 RepID=A0AAN8USB1_9MAGN
MKPQDRHRTSLGVPLPNGMHVRSKSIPSAYQSAYNCLLKSGRGFPSSTTCSGGRTLKVDRKLYTPLISTCAKSGKVDAMFEKMKPDQVVFDAPPIIACAQSGAVDRAFDVLAETRAETRPIETQTT